MGRFESATASYRRALAITPDDPALHATLGVTLGRQGKLAEAADALTRSVALKPDSPQAHYNLGFACENLRRYDEAITLDTSGLPASTLKDALSTGGKQLSAAARAFMDFAREEARNLVRDAFVRAPA